MPDQHPRAFTHVGLTVSDIETAMEWYADVLDFEVLAAPTTIDRTDGLRWRRVVDLLGVECDAVRVGNMATGNQVGVEFFEFDATDGTTDTAPAEPGFFHIGVLDPEIEQLARRIDDRGGDHYSQIWELSSPATRATYCRDPWDNRVEIYTQSHERFHVADVAETDDEP
jgi:catechol 2,3-dioxygenase-like lactoylglutathione lyase family enzyme